MNQDQITRLIDALEVGRDAAHEVAQRFHDEMKGYREAEHKQVDKDVADLNEAIAMLEAECTTAPATTPDTSQDWAKLDGAQAFHLIERHANDWAETGNMMESWLAARMGVAPVSLTDEQIQEIAMDTGASGWIVVFAREIERLALLAAAPAPIQQTSPVPLFDRKLADLQQRGYEVIGRILHKDGEYALFDSSCRWLTKPEYQRLMHEQDGSLFATPARVDTVGGETERERVARAIWNLRREDEDRCDMDLEDISKQHSVWAEADAAIAAMQSKPNADCSGEPANCPDNEGYGCACDPMSSGRAKA